MADDLIRICHEVYCSCSCCGPSIRCLHCMFLVKVARNQKYMARAAGCTSSCSTSLLSSIPGAKWVSAVSASDCDPLGYSRIITFFVFFLPVLFSIVVTLLTLTYWDASASSALMIFGFLHFIFFWQLTAHSCLMTESLGWGLPRAVINYWSHHVWFAQYPGIIWTALCTTDGTDNPE